MNYIKLFENFENFDTSDDEIIETIKEILYPISDNDIEYNVEYHTTTFSGILIYFDLISPNDYLEVFHQLIKYVNRTKYKISKIYYNSEYTETDYECPECRSRNLRTITERENDDYFTCVDCGYDDKVEYFITDVIQVFGKGRNNTIEKVFESGFWGEDILNLTFELCVE